MANDSTRLSCREFVEALASSAPVPGGGGAAALVGAIGAALGNMVGSLTVGKKKYAGVEAEIVALKEKCDALQAALLDQVLADAEGFEPLAKAYGIPKDDPDRERILEEATVAACASAEAAVAAELAASAASTASDTAAEAAPAVSAAALASADMAFAATMISSVWRRALV